MNNLKRNCIVYDYETTWNNASEEKCDIVQMAAIVVDLKRRVVVPESYFCLDVCPPTIDDDDFVEQRKNTIDWHCKIQDKTQEELLERWRAGTPEKKAWQEFQAYINGHSGRGYTSTPIRGGMNIRNFDMKIDARLHEKYETKDPFWPRDVFDIMDLFAYWFLYSNNPPKNFQLDTVRERLGMSTANSHDALQDVQDTADILVRFLNLFEVFTNKVPLLNVGL